MFSIVLTMLVILLIAGVVVVYVTYPHRGQEVPAAPWLGRLLRKGADSVPVLDESRF